MKISITGHTKGIGKAIADALCKDDLVLGYSRSNGFDISTSEGLDKVFSAAKHSDVFINNAYADFAQVELFNKMLAEWRLDSTKTIVNINSKAHYGQPASRYAVTKKELAKVAQKALSDNDRQCRVINISPGYVDTPRVANANYKKLSTEELADLVKFCIKQPQHIEIGELAVWITNHNI
jgi:NAD(P)-dependent dehydrogenase (short-subunit alcohol dehydrogenase family)